MYKSGFHFPDLKCSDPSEHIVKAPCSSLLKQGIRNFDRLLHRTIGSTVLTADNSNNLIYSQWQSSSKLGFNFYTILIYTNIMVLKFYTNRNIFGTIWWVFCLDIYIKNTATAISTELLELNFWANTVVFWANTVFFLANTVVFWANTVVF